MRLLFTILLFSVPLPVLAADLPMRTISLDSAIRFLVDKTPHQTSDDLTTVACSLRKGLRQADAQWVQYVANSVSTTFNVNSSIVLLYLRSHQACIHSVTLPLKPSRIISLSLDSSQVPISKNPVWNACVRNHGLSFDLIQSNIDRFIHRQRSHRKELPWTCRDYHRGPPQEWIYKDNGFDLHLMLGARGEFLGVLDKLPAGFVVRIHRSSPVSAGTP